MAQLAIPLNLVLGTLQTKMGRSRHGWRRNEDVQCQGDRELYLLGGNPEYGGLECKWQKIIYLKDVADVHQGFEENRHIARLNGHRCVFVTAAQKPKENISNTQAAYLPILEEFKKDLPPNIDFVAHFDQAENVANRLSGLGIDFLIAILLVFITLLPLGGRAATVVMISIPLHWPSAWYCWT